MLREYRRVKCWTKKIETTLFKFVNLVSEFFALQKHTSQTVTAATVQYLKTLLCWHIATVNVSWFIILLHFFSCPAYGYLTALRWAYA